MKITIEADMVDLDAICEGLERVLRHRIRKGKSLRALEQEVFHKKTFEVSVTLGYMKVMRGKLRDLNRAEEQET